MIYKTLLRKLEMEQREPHYKPRMNYGSMDVIGWASSSCFTGDTVVSLLNDTYIL